MPQTSKEYFKILNIIYIAIIFSQLIFAGIIFTIVYLGLFLAFAPDLIIPFIIVTLFLLLGGVVVGKIVFQNRLNSAKTKPTLKEKMTEYRTALVIRYAFLEGPTFFSLVSLLLTGYSLFLIVPCIVIAFFLTIRPSPDRAVMELELSNEESRQVYNADAFIA